MPCERGRRSWIKASSSSGQMAKLYNRCILFSCSSSILLSYSGSQLPQSGKQNANLRWLLLGCRFEMPYHIWCGGCGSMIAQGVRFNAEKKQIGNYYSTKASSLACAISIATMPFPCYLGLAKLLWSHEH